jgi:hypothetical protein
VSDSSRISRRDLARLAAGLAVAPSLSAADRAMDTQLVLADWKNWPLPECQVSSAAAEPDQDGCLEIRIRKGGGRSGIRLQPGKGSWNLESFAEIAVQVRNLGTGNVRVILRLDDGEIENLAPQQRQGADFEAVISPLPEPVWLVVRLGDKQPSPLAGKLVSMMAPPPEFVRPGRVDGARVTAVSVFVPDPESEHTISVGPVIARGVPAALRYLSVERAFPFIDEFGQYVHRDWAGKIHKESDFVERRRQETADLAAHARPADWDRFGGWANGLKLAATGFFRVEKVHGVWWMVDPEGRLFWSHGVVRVGTRILVGTVYHGTPLPEREHYFRLPQKDSPLGAFYDTEPQSTRGYYAGRENHAIYDFLEANLFRKYGANWRAAYAAQSQRRLANWGLNTIANSSDPAIYLQRQTPYTAVVYSAPFGRSEFRIQGSAGNWGKLPDPFDPGWRQLMERTLRQELREVIRDPWCLGFFVDNELAWGDTCHLAEVVLASSGNQPAKQAFVEELKKKYADVQALNTAWSTLHEGWDAVLAATAPPDRNRAAVRGDLEGFSARVADAYFRGCRDAVKAAAPNHLYLGARFAGPGNAMVMGAASRYCDIVSINRYAATVSDLALPDKLDRPIIIGEFHFGALDAAPFGVALVRTANQIDRARAYRTYLESALRNPAIVGTHWFQFYDQPATGRFDGENYNIGLLDICDTPYRDMIEACRQTGATLYRMRMKV